ncbi:MAG: hypothetical protein JWN89_307 [Parcubacteria group bacterium]|nr:hypothetical protein [Parcubacteria group bacterium]
MSKFQIILLAVFGVFIVLAVLLFSVSRGSSSASATVVVWGNMPFYDFSSLLNNAGLNGNSKLVIKYVEKPEATFDADFTEALAVGSGPDLVLLPQSKIWKERNKLLLIPAASIAPKDFISTFVDEADLLLTSAGTYGLPLYIDPLVMYTNRDLLSKASFANPPKYWDEIYDYANKLTERDNAGNVSTSAIALGEAKNIPNAKDILSLLMLQAGTPITYFQGADLHSALEDSFNLPLLPAAAALDFYTQFSNPAKPYYSWNRSLLPANTAFTSGKTALYLGYASELTLLKAKNPTLSLGVSLVPQSRVSGKSLTYGRLETLSVVKNTPNAAAALEAALLLVSQNSARALTQINFLPPARRDLLSERQADPNQATFYTAALQSKGWIDPDDIKTEKLFTDMIESVTSGRARTDEAISSTSFALDSLAK